MPTRSACPGDPERYPARDEVIAYLRQYADHFRLTVPGLYFVGLSNQRTFASATLRGVGPDAAVVVRHLIRHLAPATRAFIPARLRLTATQICCPTR